jgi:predicted metal-dependent peptidase
MNKQAHKAIVKARSQLIVSQPFFGCLALHLETLEIQDKNIRGQHCETMAVDGVHMYYWPDFVLKLTEDKLVGVIAHEILHCAYKHFSRRGQRDPLRWNFAGDYVINSDLLKVPFVLPKSRLHDPKYDGMSTEEIYERLPKIPTMTITLTPGDLDGGGCGISIDIDGAAVPEEVAAEWEANVRLAINVAKSQNAGRLPAHLARLAQQLEEPKVSWRDLTQQFIDQSMTKDHSWSRPNRRYISSGLILPGHIPDALHHLVGVIDTSGSIQDDLMRAMISEMAGALNQGVADKLTIIYADAAVERVDEFHAGDLVIPNPAGGGGTDFDDSFRWIKEHACDASCIVYLTDMMTTSWGEDLGIPTLWAAYATDSTLAQYVPPFGDVIKIESAF